MPVAPEARPTAGPGRSEQVRTIFSEIAPRYDLLNHALSFTIDRRWRRRAVDRLGWRERSGGVWLDGCAGTFDLALELAGREGFGGRIVAVDFAFPMLAEGKEKIAAAPVSPVCGDALRLPFPDGRFAGVTIGFGVRNLADRPGGFAECHRVLEPGGRLVVLEFTVPPSPWVRRAYMAYFNHILPRVGRLVSGHPWAYTYLPESVKDFPGPEGVADEMRGAGFASVSWELVTGGIAAIHLAVKGGREGP